ncbi:MAG: DUF5685 family protein [Eubacteriales bacterium]
MFGYIRPAPPELKVKEYSFYRAAYCGLCRSLGKYTGQLSRMTLSYDFVFLALLRASLTGEKFELSKRRCFVHPTAARPMISDCGSLRYCVFANALLSYHNVRDKISDSRGLRHIASCMLLPEASHIRNAALREEGMTELDAFIAERLTALSALEAQREASPDRVAQVFGELLSRVFSHGLCGSDERIAAQIGLHIGRWIYLVDAADDYGDDRRTGSYNPFAEEDAAAPDNAAASEKNAVNVSCRCKNKQKAMPERCDELFASLRLEMSTAAAALELIDFRDEGVAAILRNIIYQGLSDPLYAAGGIFKNALKEKDGAVFTVPKDI